MNVVSDKVPHQPGPVLSLVYLESTWSCKGIIKTLFKNGSRGFYGMVRSPGGDGAPVYMLYGMCGTKEYTYFEPVRPKNRV